ncbi:MAG TPA: acyl-CoA dehydrogenase family protein [Dehalococcoidia bacterium]|nr:acyl-CoA dehydrogenase family protein [Dehalococcoidia bacterium]
MDWRDTPEQAAFRAEVRHVLETRLPERYRELASRGEVEQRAWEFDRKSPDPETRRAAADWHRALSEHAWVAPHWPTEYGGAGLGPMEQFILNQEIARAGAPTVGGSGVSLLGPTLIVHGSEGQRQKYLPSILAGETAWAQGYSEPGSGSDLASLQTRAERDGDDFVINGQKIWTSGAHTADAMFLLARTDPDAPKHRGISFLLIDDITSPGISVQPLVDMSGGHYFNQVFFDDVRIPATNLVGELNRGWYVGMTLLDFERSNIAGAVANRRTLQRLLGLTRDHAVLRRRAGSGVLRQELAQRYIETEVMFQYSFRIISMQARGMLPNYEASTAKLFNSELTQRVAQTAMNCLGLRGNLSETDGYRSFVHGYLGAVPATIRGGTSEVQRNIIATRGLGLPRS